jgi:peptide/nickel transport system substrate-binding protein
MKFSARAKITPSQALGLMITLTLLLAVACGTAAPQQEQPAEPTPQQAGVQKATPVPQSEEVPAPAEVQIHSGKLTVMLGDLGDGRLDEAFASPGGGQASLVRLLGGFLISDNEQRGMVPGIATKWGVSADGLTWNFTVREGVKFHDGSDLTPEDVTWTFNHYFGPEAQEYILSTSTLQIARSMEKIEVSGPDVVTMITKNFISNMLEEVSEAGSEWKHIMPERAKLNDEQEALAYDRNPVGAGSMSLVNLTPAYQWSLERFDDYYYQPQNGLPEDRRVKFQSLDMFVVPEESTRVAALRAGETDIAPVTLAAREQVEAGGGRLVFSQEGVASHVRLLACYDSQYPCHDKRVRQALYYALDKELIRDRLYGGSEVFQIKGWDVIGPSNIAYTPGLEPFPFDPEKARQLLAEAGYPNGQGFGKLIVNTYPATAMPFVVEGAQLAADMWRKELGLDVEVMVRDNVGTKKLERSGELNGQILWRDNENGTDPTGLLTSGYGDPESVRRLHEDPEIFRLVQEALRIVDANERAEAYKQLIPRLQEEAHLLGVGYVNIPWGVGPRVLTWEPRPVAEYFSAPYTITLK